MRISWRIRIQISGKNQPSLAPPLSISAAQIPQSSHNISTEYLLFPQHCEPDHTLSEKTQK